MSIAAGFHLTPQVVPHTNVGLDRLSGVLKAATCLGGEQTTDVFLRAAVELARECIGLERASIYLTDPRLSGRLMRGTWGTGAEGNTENEHQRFHECPLGDSSQLLQLQSQGSLWFERKTQPAQEVVLRHWWVATPLVAANQLVGIMYNDSALTHRSIDPEQQALTAVFCSVLSGHLLSRRETMCWPEIGKRSTRTLIPRALALLEARPDITGEMIADQLQVSAGHLARSFKAEMGVSLVEHRNRLRLQRFAQIVRGGERNLSAAAARAGFGSYTQFHRVYRSMYGKKPSELVC